MYLQGFASSSANSENAKAQFDLKRKSDAVEDDAAESSGVGHKKIKPSFMPPALCTPPDSKCVDVNMAKEAIMKHYLNSCSEFLNAVDSTDVSIAPEKEIEKENDQEYTNPSEKPTETTFWRDGEEVTLNDGDDGISTDYLVKCVFQNILATLKLFSACQKTAKIPKDTREALKLTEHHMKALNSNQDQGKRYTQICSIVKGLLLAMDTSKGPRKCIVNQLYPKSCVLSKDDLKGLCRFNGFGTAKHGYLDCKFYIPIKLIFLGNLQTQTFENHDTDAAGVVYKVEPCRHFGPYFYQCLENIYDTCFRILENRVQQYKEGQVLQAARYENAIKELKVGNMSSLMRLEGMRQPTGHGYPATSSKNNDFLDSLPDLTRREMYKISGTSGKVNNEARLVYIRYDRNLNTVTQNMPEDEVDALFVTSFIRFRIREDGGVVMDVYTRTAVQLETEENDDVVK